MDFWGRLRDLFVDHLLQDVQDGTVGLVEQIRTQESLHSLTPCCQSRPSLKQVIADSHRLQGQGWESDSDTEAPIPEPPAQVSGPLPNPHVRPRDSWPALGPESTSMKHHTQEGSRSSGQEHQFGQKLAL